MAEKKVKTIGVLTSGGDAPGMNAAIRAVVRRALAQNVSVKGILKGYDGLINNEMVDKIGDIVIEDNGDGIQLIDDYREDIERIILG